MAAPSLEVSHRFASRGGQDRRFVPRGIARRWEAGAGPRWVVVVAVTAAVALRLWFLSTVQSAMDGDEAVTGIMVQRILEGHFYVFFAGQAYNGALDQYVQALMYLVARLPMNAFTLRLPMVGYATADCVLIYLVGARMLATRWHGAFAALLFALGPYWNIWIGSRSYGSAYTSALVVALAGLYAALRLRGTPQDSRWWAAAFGLCCGLDLWLGVTGAYLLIPAGVWVAASVVRCRRAGPAVVAGVLAGSAPVSLWMILHAALPNLGGPQPATTLAQRVHVLAGPIVREWLGVGYINDTPGWPAHLQSALAASLALAWLAGVVLRRQGLLALVTLRPSRRRPIDVLLLAVPLIFALYCSSPNAWAAGTPRYLADAYPVLVLGLAAVVPRRPSLGAPLALVVLAAFAGTSLTMLADRAGHARALTQTELEAAVSYLVAHHERFVYSDYWSGMPLQFVARSRLAVGVEASGNRFPGLRRAVDRAPSFVYMEAGDPVGYPAGIQAVLDAHHVHYHLARLGVIHIFDHLEPLRRPWQLGIGPQTLSATS